MSRRRGVVVLGAVLCAATSAGCAGDTDVNGALGITVTAEGAPVAVAEVCSGSIDEITVSGPNRGEQPNESRADLSAPGQVTESTRVDLVAPGGGWTGTPLSLPLDDDLHIVLAADRDRNSELTQTEFTVAQLGTLTPETVQYSVYDEDEGSRPVQAPLADFHDIACERD